MLKPTNIRYFNYEGAEGSVSDLLVMDVNGDGFLDLVGTSIFFPLRNKSLPVFTLINDQNGGFEPQTTDGSTVHAREFVVADFNGDGIDDIFIADHGYDVPPFPGYRNTLLLGQEGGGFSNAPTGLPSKPDFTHSATAADIDGDGDLDLFVGNIYGGKAGPYILLNNGSAVFKVKTALLPDEITNRSKTYTTSLFVDIDKDGDADLLLGADGAAGALLINNGKGKFSLSKQKMPEGVFGAKNTITVDAQTHDFDQNGRDEVILVGTRAKQFYTKASIQVLTAVGNNGKTVDSTNVYFDSQPTINGWMHKVQFIDLNHDGHLDIIGQVAGGQDAVVAYLNDGNSRYYQMDNKVLLDFAGRPLTVIDVDNDGRDELVQVGSANGLYDVTVVTLLTTAGDVVGSAAKDTVFGDDSSQKIEGLGGNDFLAGGGGDDHLLGGGGNDKLLGGEGNDILEGGAGKDVLAGGRGADVLTGGAGSDTFVFSSRFDSTLTDPDTITDFSRSQGDKINLRSIDASTKAAADQAFSFIGAAEFTGKAGQLRFERTADATNIYGDINGDRLADFMIVLEGSMKMKAADFIL
jgi:Ca2+-binding RTX toxin-like protein